MSFRAFEAVEFAEALAAHATPKVRRLTAQALAAASIELNNSGVMLPEKDWRAVRSACDALDTVADRLLTIGAVRGDRPPALI